MDHGKIMEIMTDAFLTGLKVAAPPLLISLAVGLIIAIIQAATQIHEQTLTFVPKLVAIGLTLILLGPWMGNELENFTIRLFEAMAIYA